ncbi:MAG: hypothetical protein A2Z07_05205 [Armatimonadetes bacterium RBG_16_67_12]|nr:MAG: hypothetical protein A2Z07_05205 [Armatimonadetes bacterium RBG_16_67_12]
MLDGLTTTMRDRASVFTAVLVVTAAPPTLGVGSQTAPLQTRHEDSCLLELPAPFTPLLV